MEHLKQDLGLLHNFTESHPPHPHPPETSFYYLGHRLYQCLYTNDYV